MRFGLRSVCAALLLTVAFAVFAQQRQRALIDSTSIDLKLDFFEAPSLPVTGGIPAMSASSSKWLIAVISYIPVVAYENGKGKKQRYRWMDDLTIEMSLIIPGAEPYGRFILLSGKQVLWSVQCDGRRHRALFAVPPLVFERYGTIDKFSKAAAGQIPAYIEFKSKNQEILARYIHAPKNQDGQKVYAVFNQLFNSQVGVFKLPTIVLPKEKTPWNLVEIDAFDLPKSIAEGK